MLKVIKPCLLGNNATTLRVFLSGGGGAQSWRGLSTLLRSAPPSESPIHGLIPTSHIYYEISSLCTLGGIKKPSVSIIINSQAIPILYALQIPKSSGSSLER